MSQGVDTTYAFSNNAQHVSSGFDDALASQNIAFLSIVKSMLPSFLRSELADNDLVGIAQQHLPSLINDINQITGQFNIMTNTLYLLPKDGTQPEYILKKGNYTLNIDHEFRSEDMERPSLRRDIVNIREHSQDFQKARKRIESGTGVKVKDINKMAALSEIVANAKADISDMQLVNAVTGKVVVPKLVFLSQLNWW
jgi:hypothetical protein